MRRGPPTFGSGSSMRSLLTVDVDLICNMPSQQHPDLYLAESLGTTAWPGGPQAGHHQGCLKTWWWLQMRTAEEQLVPLPCGCGDRQGCLRGGQCELSLRSGSQKPGSRARWCRHQRLRPAQSLSPTAGSPRTLSRTQGPGSSFLAMKCPGGASGNFLLPSPSVPQSWTHKALPKRQSQAGLSFLFASVGKDTPRKSNFIPAEHL